MQRNEKYLLSYEAEYRRLVEGWREGLSDLLMYEGVNKQLDEMIFRAKAVLCQYESAYHHIQFVNRRNIILDKTECLAKTEEKMRIPMF